MLAGFRQHTTSGAAQCHLLSEERAHVLTTLILQILWTFSIYLESVAILPQLFMISKTGEAETITTHYLFFLGLYRALYIANWVWRYHTEKFYDQIAVVSGVVQTIFYCDFFYLYVTKGWCKSRKFHSAFLRWVVGLQLALLSPT